MLLVLFDIDGTLVRTGGAGFRALDRAFVDLFGFTCPADLPLSGKTDPLIVEEVFVARTGRPPAPDAAQRVLDLYVRFLADEVARSATYRVLPGVPAALDRLEAGGDAVVGLATGNVEDGARIKLERGGLWGRFRFGGYGSDAADRPRLVARAIERGERYAGRTFPRRDIVVIGDTPRDVAAAHACGVTAIGVATGPHAAAALHASGADVVMETLEELPAWLDRR